METEVKTNSAVKDRVSAQKWRSCFRNVLWYESFHNESGSVFWWVRSFIGLFRRHTITKDAPGKVKVKSKAFTSMETWNDRWAWCHLEKRHLLLYWCYFTVFSSDQFGCEPVWCSDAFMRNLWLLRGKNVHEDVSNTWVLCPLGSCFFCIIS